jgi:hypothetical protein
VHGAAIDCTALLCFADYLSLCLGLELLRSWRPSPLELVLLPWTWLQIKLDLSRDFWSHSGVQSPYNLILLPLFALCSFLPS